jgi:hypothetical protein
LVEAFNFYQTPALDFPSSLLTNCDSRGSPSTQLPRYRCQNTAIVPRCNRYLPRKRRVLALSKRARQTLCFRPALFVGSICSASSVRLHLSHGYSKLRLRRGSVHAELGSRGESQNFCMRPLPDSCAFLPGTRQEPNEVGVELSQCSSTFTIFASSRSA